jgi:hypothetical protein
MGTPFRLLLTCFLLSVCQLASGPTQARETLLPSTDCPKVDGGEICVVGGLVAVAKARQLLRTIRRGDTVTKVLLVSGSLNGGNAKPYALKFTLPTDDYFANTNHSGPVATLTNATDKPLVVTNRGTLLILTKGVQTEPIPNTVIIDERHWRVLARYYKCIDFSLLAQTPTVIWDDGRQRCVAVRRKPGAKHQATSRGCRSPAPAECGAIQTDLAPEIVPLRRLEAAVRELRSLGLRVTDPYDIGLHFGGAGWLVLAFRVPHTHLIVIHGYCADCE